MTTTKGLMVALLVLHVMLASSEVSADWSVREPRHVRTSIQAGGPLCSSAGYNGNCCMIGLTSCRVNHDNDGTFCYCDISCYLYGDCCSDIATIGCPPPDQSTCSELTLANGRINYNPLTNPKRVGTIARHFCNDNYVLVGDVDRVCMYDAEWGGSPPTCERVCPELDIENGAIQYRTPNATISSQIKVRTVALTECNLGSALVGNEVRICQSNGQWSGNNASCAACPDLEIDNGVIDCRIDLMSNQEPVRTVAVAKCNPGFALRGDERRICQSNGQNNAQWSGIEATCIAASCTAAGFTGCCTSNDCIVGRYPNICNCGIECYNRQGLACCADIEHAGCFPTTCSEANLSPGCCDWSVNASCYVPGGTGCNCDQDCHQHGDCCSDVPNDAISCSLAVSRQEMFEAMRQGYRRRPQFLSRNRAGQARARDMTKDDWAAIERAREFGSMTRDQGQRSRDGTMRQNDIEKILDNVMYKKYHDSRN